MSGALEELKSLKSKVKEGTASASDKLRLRRLKLEIDEANLAKKAAKIADRKRSEETKLKIILGAWVLHNKNQPEFKTFMASSLPRFLSEKDRLFVESFLEMK